MYKLERRGKVSQSVKLYTRNFLASHFDGENSNASNRFSQRNREYLIHSCLKIGHATLQLKSPLKSELKHIFYMSKRTAGFYFSERIR